MSCVAVPVFRVKNWKKLFENNRTKDMKNMTWVPVPNKHDGRGYKRVMRSPDGPALYGCWMVILQVASKGCPRGTLTDNDGQPYTASDIADKASIESVELVQRTLDRVLASDVAWIETVRSGAQTAPQEPAAIPQEPAAIPQEPAEIPQEPARKGMEGNGREENSPKPPPGACERDAGFWIRVIEAKSGPEGKYGRLFQSVTFDTFADVLRVCRGWTDDDARKLVNEIESLNEHRIGNPKAWLTAGLGRLVCPPDKGTPFQKKNWGGGPVEMSGEGAARMAYRPGTLT